MDYLFIIAVAQLTICSLLALYFESKAKIFVALALGVLISWYIGMYRVEMFNELAVEEYRNGMRDYYPSDGGSNVFSLYFGWMPGLIYSCILFGLGKAVKLFMAKK